MRYHKHHKACQGHCAYCQQLLRENPGKTVAQIEGKQEEDEAQFSWDEASVIL